MTRPLLLALLLSGTAVRAQEAAVPAGTADPVAGPVASWQSDPSAPIPGGEADLDAFEYLARPLVVFSESPQDPLFVEQMRLLAADPGALAQRDVAVVVDADAGARSAVREALRPRGFALVLLDKDGRVALRRPSPLTVREIARAIDNMPLRQEEIRSRGAGEG